MTSIRKVVAITRAAEQARDLRVALLELGASVLEFPLIRFQPPTDSAALYEAINRIGEYDWLIFTSTNGVERFFNALRDAGKGCNSIPAKVAVVGMATGTALAQQGIRLALTPADYTADALLDEMIARGVKGSRILLARAAVGRSVLPDGLQEAGAHVDVAAVYETLPDRDSAERLCRALRTQSIDVLTFTSSSAVHSYVDIAGNEAAALLATVCVACIGPITASTARKAGLRVDVVADEYSTSGLVEALRLMWACMQQRKTQ